MPMDRKETMITNSENKPRLSLPGSIHLIGCGGTGSWVYPALIRIVRESAIHLWDGDVLEDRNLDRQLFTNEYIGDNKAESLYHFYGGVQDGEEPIAHEEYFHSGSEGIDNGSLLLCCADNHTARLACLIVADLTNSTAIIAGNEYTDADAYLYDSGSMRGTPNDPRVFAPEITTDASGDPRSPVGCTGHEQVLRSQLVIANMASAVHMLRLMWWWFAEAGSLPRDTRPYWPVLHMNSASRCFTVLYGDRKPKA